MGEGKRLSTGVISVVEDDAGEWLEPFMFATIGANTMVSATIWATRRVDNEIKRILLRAYIA